MPTSPAHIAELVQAFAKRKPGQPQPGQPQGMPPGAMVPGMDQGDPSLTPQGSPMVPGQDGTGQSMPMDQGAGMPTDNASGTMEIAHDMPPHLSLRAYAATPEGQKIMQDVIARVGAGAGSSDPQSKRKPLRPAKK